ncbi:TetR family transcriptional regulator [Streptomyces sp. ODS28]|uniref:TetR family transcriptional regulator n=1 Tax=Streptomyces sp. ODS28 TaxID=3136688 RepID=UPI0031E682E2
MPPETLTPERILRATEDVLRRHGPAKATVVDVARELGVSHGSVYRHFRTKAALREAVTQRWLDRTTEKLSACATGEGPAEERMRAWLSGLFEAKRRKAGDDPELFATYMALVGESSGVVSRHIDSMVGQLAGIVEDGRAQGVFGAPDATSARTTARALFDATVRFHDPGHAAEWTRPGIQEEFEALLELLMQGLRAQRP